MRLSNKNRVIALFALFVLYTTIANFSIYKFGEVANLLLLLLISVLSFLLTPSMYAKYRHEMLLFGIGWGFIYFISVIVNGAVPPLRFLTSLVFGILFMSFTKEIQFKVFVFFVWIFAILLSFSIIEYVIYVVTGKGILLGTVIRSTDAHVGSFNHYLFNIISKDALFLRFKGLADEPGYVGTLCGLLLFVIRRIPSLKYPYYIVLFSGLLTLSLAFYIMLFVLLVTHVRLSMKKILLVALVSTILFHLFSENIEYRLLARFDNMESLEDLDNRTTDTFDYYFNKAFKEGDLWFGVGADNLPKAMYIGEGGNAGAKKWIFEYGIIGFVILFLVYNIIYLLRNKGRMVFADWLFLVVFWASFYQRQTIMIPCMILLFFVMPILNEVLERQKI